MKLVIRDIQRASILRRVRLILFAVAVPLLGFA